MSLVKTPPPDAIDWTTTLADFLRREPQVAAIRIDPTARKVAVATRGAVDEVALQTHLAATLTAIEAHVRSGGAVAPAPAGYTLRREGATTELTGPSCVTAPKFWKWRDFEWPAASEATREDAHGHEHEDWRELAGFAIACGALGVGAAVVDRLGWGPSWLPRGLYFAALVAGGWDAAKDSWENLRARKVDIHFLMLAVAIGAASIGAWGEGVLLLFLFSASGAMEAYAMERTHREVDSLLRSAPKQALRITDDGREEEVAVDALVVGDRVRVKPGLAYPADGVVVKGRSASDESTLTGESVPVEKSAGDQVFSGTLNLWGALDYEVQRLPAESTLQKIIRLIQTAQKLRAPSERFTDRFGSNYTWLVLGVCLGMFLVWWLGFSLPPFRSVGEEASAFYRAMTLLVVMSPCALVLSIPSAILAAIAWGAKNGVLFRGGAAIEKLADIGVVALDKTGTLTTGELAVVSYESFPAGREQEVMERAYALEARSHHPLARAIVRDARGRGVAERAVAYFESITGSGVLGRLGDTRVLLGRRELLESGPLSEWARQLPPAPAELAEVWVISDDLVGRVLLRDELRASSRDVLAALRQAGLRTVMLTGDRRQTAEAVARDLGLDEVRAGLSPEGKVDALRELKASGRGVAMVGDGVNDAPSLAAADVSIAMGARGSDAALEQAEVILMHDRIENFLAALRLSRRAKAIIRQNLAISLGVVAVMALASIVHVVPLGWGVAAHEGSTVIVCLNSLRLLLGRNQ
ncbi:MAG TPA: heavy metal translocating P-type ATPase [Candidatus Synoicihabitans sp.]|nr:heavy metal translocating P-type ATPase [Candidatus Synoicihabitans sp.]